MATKQATTLLKGLDLLQAILADSGASTLSELAMRQGMPLPTAHRLAITLEAANFIERQSKGRYIPGPALTGIVPALRRPEDRIALRLRRSFKKLAARYGVFLHFGVLEEGMVTYLVKENGGQSELFTAEQMQLEAYCSAVGKVLLAALPRPELDEYLANGPFVALTDRTLTEPDDIRQELAGVRAEKLAFDRFEIREDLFCVAVPVADPSGHVVGGLSASFLGTVPDSGRLDAVKRALKSLASQVAREEFRRDGKSAKSA